MITISCDHQDCSARHDYPKVEFNIEDGDKQGTLTLPKGWSTTEHRETFCPEHGESAMVTA